MGCSPWMRKQEPDKYPLHCRTLLMTQELVASAAASTLEQPQPPAGCDALRTVPAFSSMPFKPFPPAQVLVLVMGREGDRGVCWPLKAALRVSVPPQ